MLAGRQGDHGAPLAVTRFGEPHLTRAPRLSQASPDVVATGVALWPAAAGHGDRTVGGRVVNRDGERLTLRVAGLD